MIRFLSRLKYSEGLYKDRNSPGLYFRPVLFDVIFFPLFLYTPILHSTLYDRILIQAYSINPSENHTSWLRTALSSMSQDNPISL